MCYYSYDCSQKVEIEMARVKPLVLQFENAASLTKAKENYDFIGQETELNWEKLELVVLTLPKKYKKKMQKEARIKARKEPDDYDDYDY